MPPSAAGKGRAIFCALDAKVSAHAATFHTPVIKSWRQQSAAAEERLYDDGFTAELVAHHYPCIAVAGQSWQIVNGKWAGRHVGNLTQYIVDIEFYSGGRGGKASQYRHRLADETGRQRKITAELNAAKVNIASQQADAGDTIAESQGFV